MRVAWIVAGLGFGDEGKGGVVDYLVRRTGARLVVRYNGGCQASHRVETPEGQAHAFHQWGAGTFAGADTYLAQRVVVDPILMRLEAMDLAAQGVRDPWARLTVDPRCPVATPVHRAANRAKEERRGAARHGSCGLGVGEVAEDLYAGREDLVLRWQDLAHAGRKAVREKLWAVLEHRLEQQGGPGDGRWPSSTELEEWMERAGLAAKLARIGAPWGADGDVVFEGAQGALLDAWHGFHPHTSWTDATTAGAREVLAQGGWQGGVEVVGVLRAYATRHGAGPLPTEHQALPARLRIREALNEPNHWQGALRFGWADAVLARYGRDIVGPTQLAVTCLDHAESAADWRVATGYDHMALPLLVTRDLAHMARVTTALAGARPVYFEAPGKAALEVIEESLRVPVAISSHGPTHAEKATLSERLRRQWRRAEMRA